MCGLAATSVSGQRGGPPQAPPTAKAAAPIDLTGYWASVVSEDWRYRMTTPPKGDVAGVPLNASRPSGRRRVGSGARRNGWRAMQSVRRRRHHADARPAAHDLAGRGDVEDRAGCGNADAHAVVPRSANRGRGLAGGIDGELGSVRQPDGPRWFLPWRSGARRVVEGPDHQDEAGVFAQERRAVQRGCGDDGYFDRFDIPNGDSLLVVSTELVDPTYLATPFWTSTHFKKQNDASGWNPKPCSVR